MALVVFLVLAFSGAGVRAETPDPRLEEARGLLGDASAYERAESLLRDVLADDPGADEARMWLARLLSWRSRYDEALGHYEHFVLREEPPAWAPIERAEVLSWAGRAEDAEAAFQALLEADPENARAARGLARVYAWSGRPALADAAYERALALEEDAEARRELLALRSGIVPEVSTDTGYFGDDQGFWKLLSRAEATFPLGYRTRLVATAGWARIARDGSVPPPPGGGSESSLQAFEARLGVERAFGERVTARLDAGARVWLGAPDHFFGRASVEVTAPTGGVFTLSADHGDFLARSDSFHAVAAGIRDTTVRLAAWQPLHERVALFGWAEGTFLDDGNRRAAGGLSLDYTPWPERKITASLAASHTGFAKESALYYDPDVDVAGSLLLRAVQPLFEGLELEAGGAAGYGFARQDGVEGRGFTWSVHGGPTWRPGGGWWLGLRGHVGRSQRASTYASRGGRLYFGKAF